MPGVEEERLRQRVDAVGGRRGSGRVKADRIADALLLGERRRVAHGVVFVQADQRHLALLGPVERGEQRGLLLARLAPGREEVDDQRLPPVPVEGNPLTGVTQGRQAECRGVGHGGLAGSARTRPDQPDRGQRSGHAQRDEGREDLVPPRRPPDLAQRAPPRLRLGRPFGLVSRCHVRPVGSGHGFRASLPPAGSASAAFPPAGEGPAACGPGEEGSNSSNSLPSPGSLRTAISPPCARATALTSASPRPVPRCGGPLLALPSGLSAAPRPGPLPALLPALLSALASPLRKRSKTCGSSPAGMPCPVSATPSRTGCPGPAVATESLITSPLAVCRTAF